MYPNLQRFQSQREAPQGTPRAAKLSKMLFPMNVFLAGILVL